MRSLFLRCGLDLKKYIWLSGLLVLAACAAAPKVRHAVDPSILWKIETQDCLPPGMPLSVERCAAVWRDPARASVLLKDSRGKSQYLLLPIERVHGIEDPKAVAPGAPNYFAVAWDARGFAEQALGQPIPRRYLSLALNSPHGRSQNQMHIHIDCVRPQVYASLQRLPFPGREWHQLPEPLHAGHHYLARFVGGDRLTVNPLRSLAEALGPGQALADYSVAVLGAHDPLGAPGFILLATRYDVSRGNFASAEELQDHACSIVTGSGKVLEGVR